MNRLLKLCLCVLFVSTGAAFSQDVGNKASGRKLAEEICAECHSIDSGNRFSPNLLAPPFQIVADKPGMTAIAISMWFVTPHQMMPNFIFSNEQQADLIAYIRSLRSE